MKASLPLLSGLVSHYMDMSAFKCHFGVFGIKVHSGEAATTEWRQGRHHVSPPGVSKFKIFNITSHGRFI